MIRGNSEVHMFDAAQMKIHGYPVLAWAKTEDQSTGPCGYVLVEIGGVKREWVVSWYRSGDKEWASGVYHTDLADAWKTFTMKAQPHMNTKGRRA